MNRSVARARSRALPLLLCLTGILITCGLTDSPPSVGAVVDSAPEWRLTVGENVHVSASRSSFIYGEVASCIDRHNPARMAAGVMEMSGPNALRVLFFGTDDGGRHWRPVFDSYQVGLLAADPSCTFTPHGLLIAVLGSPAPQLRKYSGHPQGADVPLMINDPSRPAPDSSVVLLLSKDMDGRWDTPVFREELDRPWVTSRTLAGGSSSTFFHGMGGLTDFGINKANGDRLDRLTSMHAYRSLTNDTSFRGVGGRAAVTGFVKTPSNGVILEDGSLVFLCEARNVTNLPSATPVEYSIWSVRVSQDRDVVDVHRVDKRWPDATTNYSSLIPVLGLDESGPFRGRLYAAWIDRRLGRASVVLATSDDAGRTWRKPIVVDSDYKTTDVQLQPDATAPAIAVNKSGLVAVAWADRREHADNQGSWYRVAASADGGETFSPSVKVATQPYSIAKQSGAALSISSAPANNMLRGWNLRVSAGWLGQMGHTVQMLAAEDGAFHPFWIDDRTGTPQVWTGRVSVDLVPRTRTIDLSEQVRVELLRARIATAEGSLTVPLRLRNVSDSPISGRLFLELSQVRSELGDLEPLGLSPSDRQNRVWRLPIAESHQSLKKDAVLETELSFKIATPKPAVEKGVVQRVLFQGTVRVFLVPSPTSEPGVEEHVASGNRRVNRRPPP